MSSANSPKTPPAEPDDRPRPERRSRIRERASTTWNWSMARVQRLIDGLRELGARPDRRNARGFYPLYVLRVLIQVIKQWVRDRAPQQASSLAFQTALSLVPLLAVGLAVLRGTGEFGAESSLVEFLSSTVLPFSREEIAQHLVAWAGNLDMKTAGAAGVVSTLLLAYVLFASVEKIFNDVWRVERRRSLAQKFVVFYALVTMVPALLGLSLYEAASHGLNQGFLRWLQSVALSAGALFLANKLLPATPVRWRPAAIAAVLSALLFEAAKHVFRLYVANVAFSKYAGVYGALGLVPLTLVWIYYSWLVVLLGAEITHTMQNLQRLESADRPDAGHTGGVTAARLLCAIVERWRSGGATTREELMTRFSLSEDEVERAIRKMREGQLVISVDSSGGGYVPARAPAAITLADVLALFESEHEAPPKRPVTRLDAVLVDVATATSERTRAVTIEDLSR